MFGSLLLFILLVKNQCPIGYYGVLPVLISLWLKIFINVSVEIPSVF
jgi:hypothetical protein